MSDPYIGFHQRMKPDYNGWHYFEVYNEKGSWFWQSYDGFEHVGMREGPFDTSREAYLAGMKCESAHAQDSILQNS